MSQQPSRLSDKVFVIISFSGVIAAGIAGFWLIGSPAKQRLISLDAERVSDLSYISSQLWQQTGEGNDGLSQPLPAVLPTTNLREDTYTDPETGEPYEYRRLSETTYELCANFALASTNREPERYYDWRGLVWEHPAGRYCYRLAVGKDSRSTPVK